MNADAARFVREMEAMGWRRKPGRRHVKLLSPDGVSMMVVSATPPHWRALTNTRALAKKASKR